MPGLIEPHAHLSFVDQATPHAFNAIPVEEHLLLTLKHAKLYLDQGFTSCFSAAATKPRLDIVARNAIDRGEHPGPRLKAASVQFTVTGGVGDLRQMHLDPGEAMYTLPCDGPVEFRRAAREACREGVDVLKIVPSGRHVDTGRAVRAHADDRRRGGGRVRGGARAGARRRRACAQRRVDQDVRAPRRRRHLSRDVRRRRGARPARSAQGPRVRRARAVGHGDAAARRRQVRPAVVGRDARAHRRAISSSRSRA